MGSMSNSPKSTTAEKLLGLMIITGFILLLVALPMGLVFALQEHYTFHSDWRWAIIVGLVMTTAAAIIGGIFLGVGELIVQRHRKTRV
jgi:hypothetical protein